MKSIHKYAIQICLHFQVVHGLQVKKILVKLVFKISYFFFHLGYIYIDSYHDHIIYLEKALIVLNVSLIPRD